MITKFQIEHWDQNSNVKVCRQYHLSGQAQTSPPGYRYLQDPIVCGGLELKKSNLKNKTCLDTQPMNDDFEFFDFERIIYGPHV